MKVKILIATLTAIGIGAAGIIGLIWKRKNSRRY